MPTLYDKLATADITREDVERELERLREAAEREPDLLPVIENYPDDPDDEDIGFQEAPVTSLVVQLGNVLHSVPLVLLASKTNKLIRNNPGQKAVAARQREFNRTARLLVARYESGEWNTDQLNRALREEIKGLHVTSAVSGKGFKWDQMTFSDWGRVGAEIRKQYGFLDRRIHSVAQGNKTPKALLADLDKFAQAASASYERTAVSRTGFPVDILPTVPGAGDTRCLTRCKCWWQIRTLNAAKGNYDVSWRLGKAEHCDTCRMRARLKPDGWGNLRVRNFRFTTLPAQIYYLHR